MSLSIIYANVRSFLPKRDLVSSRVLSTGGDILLLTETWLSSDVTDREVLTDLPNFCLFRKDRTGTRGGGVLIALREHLPCSPISISSSLETLWVLIHTLPKKVLLGVCYRPPSATTDFSYQLNDIVSKLVTEHPTAQLVLFGDFNFPLIDWCNPQSSSAPGNTETQNFVDFCLNFNLSQLVSEPTRVTQQVANVLDLVLTNFPDSLSSIMCFLK